MLKGIFYQIFKFEIVKLIFLLRALYDANTQEGIDNIVATFTFEEHKIHAARMLNSVNRRKKMKLILHDLCKIFVIFLRL